MSREILFKGRSYEADEWVAGSFLEVGDGNAYILTSHGTCRVSPDTVCQYTGLKDKNGVKIFEGDILEAHLDDDYPDNITRVAVEWLDFGWVIRQLDCDCDADLMDETDIGIWTVCGNVFDDPEL